MNVLKRDISYHRKNLKDLGEKRGNLKTKLENEIKEKQKKLDTLSGRKKKLNDKFDQTQVVEKVPEVTEADSRTSEMKLGGEPEPLEIPVRSPPRADRAQQRVEKQPVHPIRVEISNEPPAKKQPTQKVNPTAGVKSPILSVPSGPEVGSEASKTELPRLQSNQT